MKKFKIIEPKIFNEEKKYILSCIKNNEISTYGRFINKFEKEVAKISSAKHSVALTSGSVGLFLALRAIKIKKSDLVIAPSYTFAATTNAIIHSNATPLLFDIEESTMCIDLKKVLYFLQNNTFKRGKYYYDKKSKKRITCICPVTTFSIVPDLEIIKKLSKKYNIKVIIDAASALTSKFKKKSLAAFSDMVVFSFNGNKSFTSGGGGSVVSNKHSYIKFIKHISTNAKLKKTPYTYSEPGFNFRMTNLHAAIGLGQLKNIVNIKKKKESINKLYKYLLKNKKIYLPVKPKWSDHDLWLNYIITKDLKIYKLISKNLKKINFNVSNFWKPMHLQKNLKFLRGSNFNYSNKIWNKVLTLPSSISLTKRNQLKIINSINKALS